MVREELAVMRICCRRLMMLAGAVSFEIGSSVRGGRKCDDGF